MRIVMIALALVLGPKLCPAEGVNLGYTSTAAVGNASLDGVALYGRSSDGALRQLTVDTAGALIGSSTGTGNVNVAQVAGVNHITSTALTGKLAVLLSEGVTGAPVAGSNGSATSIASGRMSLESISKGYAFNGTSWTALSSYLDAQNQIRLMTTDGSYTMVTNVAFTVTNALTQTVNLTFAAGVSTPLEIWLTAAQGGAALRYAIHPSYATLPSAAWLQNYGMYAASTTTTQVTGRWAPGTHITFISVGATDVTGSIGLVRK